MNKYEALKIRQILDNPDLSNNERMWEVSLLVDEALEQPAQEPVSDDEIMNIWLFCEGKVAGLNETGFDCKFPVIFSRALLEFINAKQ